ncbi:MAG: lactate utilization protein C [Isosphaeraceae bacterium]
MNTSKDEILNRIQAALCDVPPAETPDDVPIAREYRHDDSSQHDGLIDRFAERVSEYRAVVRRVSSSELPGAIASSCAARGVRSLAVPTDLPDGWVPEGVEPMPDVDGGLTNAQLDVIDGVLTACALAIAQTGTIVLDGGPGQGRRALTLLPDYHLCVVRTDQVVDLVPEGVERLFEAAQARRPMTWISGPSATSDIELSRVEGVHGPRTLEVLIVDL